ncbi:MAG: MATE family efflux transporter [Lachnospiraceae bacterium]|nr:MATE family efflux transporter [Lachnospiraceae bacterium]
MQTELSQKDEKYRVFALEAPMWRVILYVGVPLALYESLNQLFKILDTMMASHISANAVSTVAYLSQINLMLSAIGGGLAVGAGMKISEAYGAGKLELVKRRVSTVFALCAVLGGVLLLALVPFARGFLKLMNTPDEILGEGTVYFRLELFGLVLSFFNSIYIAMERARGNSRRILHLNTAVIVVKLSLTALFVYGMGGGVSMIAVATLASQAVLFAAALVHMNQRESAFGFSLKAVSMRGEVLSPMLHLSFPVIVEKAAFSMGKVIVNSMSTVYGTWTVGALGISNNIDGITTSPQNGFQSGGAAVISQNLGAKKPERALAAFRWTLLMNVLVGFVLVSLTLLFLDPIVSLFAEGNEAFAGMIKEIYLLEALGAVPLGVNAAVMALLYGFGKTKITLAMNFCRIFLFRIPVLWGLQRFTDLGNVSAGIVMAVSNILSGVLAAVVAVVVVREIRRSYGISISGFSGQER